MSICTAIGKNYLNKDIQIAFLNGTTQRYNDINSLHQFIDVMRLQQFYPSNLKIHVEENGAALSITETRKLWKTCFARYKTYCEDKVI